MLAQCCFSAAAGYYLCVTFDVVGNVFYTPSSPRLNQFSVVDIKVKLNSTEVMKVMKGTCYLGVVIFKTLLFLASNYLKLPLHTLSILGKINVMLKENKLKKKTKTLFLVTVETKSRLVL